MGSHHPPPESELSSGFRMGKLLIPSLIFCLAFPQSPGEGVDSPGGRDGAHHRGLLAHVSRWQPDRCDPAGISSDPVRLQSRHLLASDSGPGRGGTARGGPAGGLPGALISAESPGGTLDQFLTFLPAMCLRYASNCSRSSSESCSVEKAGIFPCGQ